MISEIKKYKSHYLALAIILGFGIVTILLFRFDLLLKRLAILTTAILYVAWGVIHHHRVDHLRLKVVLEYVLVAILGVLIINTLL